MVSTDKSFLRTRSTGAGAEVRALALEVRALSLEGQALALEEKGGAAREAMGGFAWRYRRARRILARLEVLALRRKQRRLLEGKRSAASRARDLL
jgi:hypothetical protein